MKSYILTALLLFLFVIAGCQTKEAVETSKENAGRLEKIDRDLTSTAESISGLKADIVTRIASLESEIGTVKKMLEKTGSKTGSDSTAALDGMATGMPGDEIENINESVSAIAISLEGLSGDVAALKAELTNLASANREVSQRVERQRNWEEMNDPQKLGTKLDAFTDKYSEKLLATGKSGEFQADMANLKTAVTAQQTTEELALKYKNELKNRIAETTDERMKGFLTRQLENLDSAQGEQLAETIGNYKRLDTMRQISEVAQKYSISRDDLQSAGLITFGGGGFGGRDGGRRGGGTGGTGGTDGGRTGGGTGGTGGGQ